MSLQKAQSNDCTCHATEVQERSFRFFGCDITFDFPSSGGCVATLVFGTYEFWSLTESRIAGRLIAQLVIFTRKVEVARCRTPVLRPEICSPLRRVVRPLCGERDLQLD